MFERSAARLPRRWKTRPATLGGIGLLLMSCGAALSLASHVHAGASRGTLTVHGSGLKHARGKVIAKLFRRDDDVPKGTAYRQLSAVPSSGGARLQFRDVPYGAYALFLFHDENGNGTLDHDFIGFPIEPLGFSAGFRPSLFTGLPDFEDLRFDFSEQRSIERIILE